MTSSIQSLEEESAEIIKADSKGRLQIPVERRDALLAEFDRSGMSGAAFARHYGIKYTTFAHWIRTRRNQKTRGRQRKRAASKSQFLMIETTPGTTSADKDGVKIELPNGCRVSLHSRQEVELVAALINALGTAK
ncbi:MAG: hypothetical protein P1V20_25645 [Verrucomicrobiales bacterium]|nr:hypothetical protein [Verrucomicrobiales bacterium]